MHRRYRITIGHPHDPAQPPVVVHGPEVPTEEQLRKWKDYRALREHPDFVRMQVINPSIGAEKEKVFRPVADSATVGSGGGATDGSGVSVDVESGGDSPLEDASVRLPLTKEQAKDLAVPLEESRAPESEKKKEPAEKKSRTRRRR